MNNYTIKRTPLDWLMDSTNTLLLLFIGLITIYPFLRILAVSLSAPYTLEAFPLSIIPRGLTFDMYVIMFQKDSVIYGFTNSLLITVFGSILDTMVTIMMAYPLAKKDFPFRNFITFLCVFVMFFYPGIVPTFLNIKSLGMMDSYLALILPRLVSSYYLLIARNFFMSISPEIEESARIDGANDIRIFFRLIIPLSVPVILTVLLWNAVYRWNNYIDCTMYITTPEKRVLPVILRDMIVSNKQEKLVDMKRDNVNISLVRTSTIVISIIPILIFYPFIQKHFIKGIMMGSLKG